MTQQPVISVCIANFNGMEIIDDCIRSVLAQQGDIDVEILVHDDASSDGSVGHIRKHYPHAKLIESLENVGFCIANNRMAAVANGKYLLLLNNDAALYPDAVQSLLAEAKRLDAPAILSLPQYDATSGELIDIGSFFDPFLNPIPNTDPNQRNVGMVIGACLWLPRTLWAELGGFPEWFDTLAEDMYLCWRARLLGYAVRVLATSGFRHQVGHSLGGGGIKSGRLSTTSRRRALSERNKTFVMVLFFPAPILQIVLPLHIVLLLAEGALVAMMKRDWVLFDSIYLAALKAVWTERKRLISLRKTIHSTRRIGRQQVFSVFHWIPHKLCLLLRHGMPKIRHN